jgi:hypothetical protein
MKIIKDYKELNKGDIVALSYIDEGVLFNTVGEFTKIDSDGDFDVKDRPYIKGKVIKTIMLLCPIKNKLELGDVWVSEEGNKVIIGEWYCGNEWWVYRDYGSRFTCYSKESLEHHSYTLRTESTPEEMTVSEISIELGREILIKKE